MNEKATGRLFAVAAVLALALCLVAVAVPAEETNAAPGDITYISGVVDKDMPFTNNNTVVVDRDLTIVDGGSLTIGNGTTFTVNEGVTLTIQEGGSLVIQDAVTSGEATTSPVSVVINGSIVVDRGGVMENNSTAYTDETGFVVNGSISVQKNGTITTSSPAETSIGIITLGENSTVSTQSSGKNHATIQNQAFLVDDGAEITFIGDLNNVYVAAYSADAAAISGIMITGIIPTDETVTSDYNRLVISSTAVNVDAYIDGANGAVSENAKIMTLAVSGTTISGTTLTTAAEGDNQHYVDENLSEAVNGYVTISDALTVAEGSVIAMESPVSVTGTLRVNGTITTSADVAISGTMNVSANSASSFTGTLEVSGTLDIAASEGANVDLSDACLKISGAGTAKVADYANSEFKSVSGAYYYDDEGAGCFSAFSAAVDGATAINASEIFVSGYTDAVYSISESKEVSGMILNVLGTVQIDNGVTLTIAEDADVISDEYGGLIIVEGTLVDNADCDLGTESADTVVANEVRLKAEVRSTDEDETYYEYTSLANALNGMSSGTVYLFGNVEVDADLIIPAGVTVNANGKSLNVGNDATLDIQGVLDLTDSGSVTVTGADAEAKKEAGIVSVGNYIAGADAVTYSTFIAGFYATGTIGDYTSTAFIMAPAVAETNAAELGNITVYGTITSGDLSFINTEDGNKTITIDGKYTSGTITIDGYNVTIDADAVYNGIIANAEGSVALANINSVTINDETFEEADRLVISGTPGAINGDDGKSLETTVVFAGTVYMSDMGLSEVNNLTIPADSQVNVTGAVAGVSSLAVEGTMNVLNGASVSATGNMDVTGTVTVSEATTDATAGTLSVVNVYVGITADEVKAGTMVSATSAAINGTVTASGIMYVAPGATLSENFSEGLKSTALYCEDSLWITMYTANENQTVPVKDVTVAVEDAYFMGWKGTSTVYTDTITIGSDEGRLDAQIDYNIYSITIVADNGIGTVAIDGIVLPKVNNMFYTEGLVAGAHEISFQPKAGFDVSGVTMTVNGTPVSGNTVTLSGTEDVDFQVTLSGTTVAEQAPVENDDDGMGITEYLLIILVILVVIMAILVAMRLMRS